MKHFTTLSHTSFSDQLALINNPQNCLPTVLVGGTNGKGTTAVALSYLLSKAGLRVGLFTSPHIQNIRERFAIDGKYISAVELESIQNELADLINLTELNYFEQLTLTAWLYFTRGEVDIAVLE